jgi:hypothetical protein
VKCVHLLLASISIATIQLGGCVVYPASRTFYEPTAAEGALRNQTSCGYLHKHDTVERRIGDMILAITVGSEKEPDARHATLKVTLVLEGQAGSWNLMTEGVRPVVNASPETLRPSSSTLRSGPGSATNQQFIRWTLTYPEPAGLADKVELDSEPGALTERGKAIDVGPLHFNRVKKADIYFGSINC